METLNSPFVLGVLGMVLPLFLGWLLKRADAIRDYHIERERTLLKKIEELDKEWEVKYEAKRKELHDERNKWFAEKLELLSKRRK